MLLDQLPWHIVLHLTSSSDLYTVTFSLEETEKQIMIQIVLDLCGQVNVGGENSLWGAFSGKLPLCLMEKMPTGSKTEPTLVKAKRISDTSSVSGIRCSRRE